MAENKHPEHGYRACLGLLSLAKRYGKPRLEAACTLALQIGICRYRHVRDILTNNRDQSAPATAGDWISPEHAHMQLVRKRMSLGRWHGPWVSEKGLLPKDSQSG